MSDNASKWVHKLKTDLVFEKKSIQFGNDFEDIRKDCAACGSLRIYPWNIRKARDRDLTNSDFLLWRCKDCRHIFINPVPGNRMLEKVYRNSGHTLKKPITIEEVESAEKEYPNAKIDSERLVSVAKKHITRGSRDLNALDIGSGYGYYSASAKRAGFKITAVNPGNWENNVYEAMHGVRPIQSFFQDVHLKKKFDLVIISQVLEHTDDPFTFLRKVRQVTKNGGICSIAVPNLDSYLVKLGRGGGVFWIPEHLHCFTEKSLKAVLLRAGFNLVESRNISRFPYYIFSEKLGLEGQSRKFCNLFIKVVQILPLKVLDLLGWGGCLNVWAEKNSGEHECRIA